MLDALSSFYDFEMIVRPSTPVKSLRLCVIKGIPYNNAVAAIQASAH